MGEWMMEDGWMMEACGMMGRGVQKDRQREREGVIDCRAVEKFENVSYVTGELFFLKTAKAKL